MRPALTLTYVVTSNFNSKPYLSIAKLSLYSIFNAIEEINMQRNYKILLIDSASTDGSFEELLELGKKLSIETKISFEAIRLDKDLGNSFAYFYGFLYSRSRGADYVIYMDNDLVVTYPETLLKMQELAEKLSRANIKYYAVAPMIIWDNRERGARIAGKNIDPRIIIQYIRKDVETSMGKKILETNTVYIDILGRVINPLNGPLLECRDIISPSHEKTKKPFIISPFAASTFSLHPSRVAPLFPFLYIWGDDLLTAGYHAYKGYYSYIIPDIIGVHYTISPKKRTSPKELYYSNRNNVFINFASGRNKHLFYVVASLYKLLLWTPQSLIGLRRYVLHFLKEKYYIIGGYAPFNATKYAVTGFIHGLLSYNKVSKLLDEWFKKYLDEPPQYDLQEYFIYKGSEAGIARLLLYIFTGRKELLFRRGRRYCLKRLFRGEDQMVTVSRLN